MIPGLVNQARDETGLGIEALAQRRKFVEAMVHDLNAVGIKVWRVLFGFR
jgi:hypothetical protein